MGARGRSRCVGYRLRRYRRIEIVYREVVGSCRVLCMWGLLILCFAIVKSIIIIFSCFALNFDLLWDFLGDLDGRM